MKYAIMSDAHGNPAALKKAYADACEQGCKKFLFLGDAVGDGYDDKTTVDFVRENFDVVLLGNHESWKMDLNSLKIDDLKYDGEDFCCAHGDTSNFKDCGFAYIDTAIIWSLKNRALPSVDTHIVLAFGSAAPKGICELHLTLLPIRISMLRNPSRCRWRMVAAISSIAEASDIRGLTYVLHTRYTILTPRG